MVAWAPAPSPPAAAKLVFMKAIGYLRVSTEEQAGSGLGLEAQRSAIAAAASRLGYELGSVFADEGVSGALPPHERPELALALGVIRKGEVLLVAKRDRLARDRIAIALLERELAVRGVKIVSAAGEGSEGTGSSALLHRGLADLLAENEREVIRERTRAALAAKRARGERTGTIPFGFRLEGKLLVADPEERRALKLMKERRAAGDGYTRICRTLEAARCRPRGKRWHPEGVRSILATEQRHQEPTGP